MGHRPGDGGRGQGGRGGGRLHIPPPRPERNRGGGEAAEEAWMESERREAARRRAENRVGWYSWHMHRAELYGRLSAEHAATAEGLLETDERRTA